MSREQSFGGQSLGRREVAGLILSETIYPRGVRMETHAHPGAYFCLVRSGAFREEWGRDSSEHRGNEVIYHPGEDEHANTFLERSRCFNVEMSESYGTVSPDRRRIEQKTVLRILSRLYGEFRAGVDSPLVVEGLVYQAVGEAFQRTSRSTRSSRWLEGVHREIENRFPEPLTLAGLSETAGVHPVHLARRYRAEFGMSIGDHVRALRISYARQMLRDRSIPLADVALQAGFSDQSHFTRVFKKSTGLTPGQCRD